MKKINELKKMLEQIKTKGYFLKDYSFTDYDIEHILENNLKKFRSDLFYKSNTLNLTTIREEYFKIHKDDNTFKDFKELETEIKKHFSTKTNKDLLNDLLKEIGLSFSHNWDLQKKPFKEIRTELEQEHKKELVFYLSFGEYGICRDITNKIEKIFQIFKISQNLKFETDLKGLEYDTKINEIENLINSSQDLFKVRIFLNHKLKIKFKDDKVFNGLKDLFINEEMKRFKKEIYINLNQFHKSELEKFSDLKIYENKGNCYLNFKLNVFDTEKTTTLKGKENILKETEEQEFKYIYRLHKGDLWRKESIKESVEESNLNETIKQEVYLIIDNFFKGVKE